MIVKQVPKSEHPKLACRRCGGWGQTHADGDHEIVIVCTLCKGSGTDPDPHSNGGVKP